MDTDMGKSKRQRILSAKPIEEEIQKRDISKESMTDSCMIKNSTFE